MNKISIDINIKEKKWTKEVTNVKSIIREACKHTLKNTEIIGRDTEICISVLLTNDSEIRKLNGSYRAKDKPTNVLSFPQEELQAGSYNGVGSEVNLGDIIFALETIKKEAQDQNKTIEHHLTHLTAHGVLHLLGYDHENDADAEVMEALEIKILAGMGVESPY